MTETFRKSLFVQSLFFQFDGFAASSFKVTHQVNACSASFLFFFKMLLEAHFLNTSAVVNNERIPFTMILCVFARKIIVAEKAAFKPFLLGAFLVFTRCTAAVQAHGTLCVGEPF